MKAADFNEPEPTNELKRFLASLFAFPGISHSWLNMPFRWSIVNLTKIAQCTSNLTSNLARVTWSISYPGLKDEQQLKVRNPAWKRVAPEPKSIPSARALLVTCIWFPFRWSIVNLTKIAQCTSNLTSNLARVTWSISYPGLKDEQQLKVRNPAWKRVAPEPKSIPSARALLVTCIWFPLGLWRANHWPVRACIQRWPASKYALRPHSSL